MFWICYSLLILIITFKKEITWYDEHDKMGYGDEKKYDKYGGDRDHDYGGYDDKNKMMNEDGKY